MGDLWPLRYDGSRHTKPSCSKCRSVGKTHQSGGIKEHKLFASVRARVFADEVCVDPLVVSGAHVAAVPCSKVSLNPHFRFCHVRG